MGQGFGKSQKTRKRKTNSAKRTKLVNEFILLMGKDNRKAAELLVKHDLYLPIRKTIDIDWYSVDAVEAWIDNEMPKINQAVEEAKIGLSAEGYPV